MDTENTPPEFLEVCLHYSKEMKDYLTWVCAPEKNMSDAYRVKFMADQLNKWYDESFHDHLTITYKYINEYREVRHFMDS